MNNEDIKKKIEEALAKQDLFIVKDVDNVNHSPHPFCITPTHISKYSLDVNAGPCGMRTNPKTGDWSTKRDNKKGIIERCTLSYDEHTSDKVLFLQHLRNGTVKEGQAIIVAIEDELTSMKVDGIAFIETDEKFRLT